MKPTLGVGAGRCCRNGRRPLKKKLVKNKPFPLRLPPGSLHLFGNQIGSIQGLEGLGFVFVCLQCTEYWGVILAVKKIGWMW
jgi:hypothetical protein